MSLKIYLVGASGVGKTTLAKYVAARHGLPMISGATRAAAEAVGIGFDAVPRPTCEEEQAKVDAFQEAVWHEQVRLERPFWDKDDGFVSDRGFDLLAYTAALSRNTERIVPGLDPYLERLFRPDVLVFFLRPHPDVKAPSDGRRDLFLTPEFVLKVDGVIEYILESRNIPHLPVRTPSFRDRTRAVDYLILKATR